MATPLLRFPEFEGAWDEVCLGDLYPKIRNGFVGTATPYYREIGTLYLQGKNVKDGELKLDDVIFISEAFHNKQKKSQLQSNDLVMVQSGHVGECAVVTDKFEGANCHALVVLSPSKDIDSRFYKGYFYSPSGKKHIYKIKTGNTVVHILTTDLKPLIVPLPCSGEQKKIADFLSAVDEKIRLLKEKQALLQQYKKGVMQKLFRQEIRFKDDNGQAFPDWSDTPVGEFMTESKVLGSKGDQAKKLTVKLWGKGVFSKDESQKGSENTQYYTRSSGQFIYSKLDFLNCAFGIVPEELDGYESTVDLPCFDVAPSINKYFILEYIKQKRFYKKFGDMADGSRKAKRIHAKDFLSFIVELPSESEQQKIAEFLQALDTKLDAVQQQIELTQTFKKGLLQKMFV